MAPVVRVGSKVWGRVDPWALKMERFEKFEPVHRVSGKIFFKTGLQTGLNEPGHSPNLEPLYRGIREELPYQSAIIPWLQVTRNFK